MCSVTPPIRFSLVRINVDLEDPQKTPLAFPGISNNSPVTSPRLPTMTSRRLLVIKFTRRRQRQTTKINPEQTSSACFEVNRLGDAETGTNKQKQDNRPTVAQLSCRPAPPPLTAYGRSYSEPDGGGVYPRCVSGNGDTRAADPLPCLSNKRNALFILHLPKTATAAYGPASQERGATHTLAYLMDNPLHLICKFTEILLNAVCSK